MSEITKTSMGLSAWQDTETMQYEHFKLDNEIINGFLEDIENSKTDDTKEIVHESLKARLEAEAQKSLDLFEAVEAIPMSYSPIDHSHDQYALKTHTHGEYAIKTHNHDTEYAPVHSHPYASSDHNHDGDYAPVHDHPYAALNHDHDGEYAPVHSHPYASSGHNHDTRYAQAAHDHDGDYAPVHSHPYASSGHNHDTRYAKVSHDHDGDYAPVHSHPYASSSHNHSGVYEPIIGTKRSGFNLSKSDSVSSTSSSVLATSKAAKVAYDRGSSALNTANQKLNRSGGTMSGQLVAQSNTAYTTPQVRNIAYYPNTVDQSTLPKINGQTIILYKP